MKVDRSKEAFNQLVQDWKGILISDNYGVYVNWINQRHTVPESLRMKSGGLIFIHECFYF